MATFTMIISDSPFGKDNRGEVAPFLETIEHGADSTISTPATEAFRRCLDAVADKPDPKSQAAHEASWQLANAAFNAMTTLEKLAAEASLDLPAVSNRKGDRNRLQRLLASAKRSAGRLSKTIVAAQEALKEAE